MSAAELPTRWRHNAQGCGRRDSHAAGTWRSCARELEVALAQAVAWVAEWDDDGWSEYAPIDDRPEWETWSNPPSRIRPLVYGDTFVSPRDAEATNAPSLAEHDKALAQAMREACQVYEAQGKDPEKSDVCIGIILDRTRSILRASKQAANADGCNCIVGVLGGDHEADCQARTPQPKASAGDVFVSPDADQRWAVDQWHLQVAERPLVNIHRRSLDDVWRQVIRHFGGDDTALCGPPHDELVAQSKGEQS